ncbi:tyrosine recombinase [Brachybacterium hainanense]|uniref:Tyrosine recombinase XerC n=1 Tax=Brachybacterium hainanense TaxID=1541174 RepID=A0ABV6RCS4_9MICO
MGARSRTVELNRLHQRTLDQHLAQLRIERGLSANSVAAYRRDLTRYLARLEATGLALEQVGPEQIAEYLRTVREGADGFAPLAASSAARALAAVRGLHSFLAEEHDLSGTDPTRAVPAPSRPQRLPHPLEIEEVIALIEASGRERGGRLAVPRALRDRALLELLYGLGARISEAVGIDLDDLDRDGRAVVLHGKGDKHRVVPAGTFALDAVDAYVSRGRPALLARGGGSPALFLGSRGTRLSRQAAWAIVAEAAETAGLQERVSPHTLRHSYATHLLHGGADVRSVQELLGHASVTTTQLYTKVTVDTLRAAHAAAHPRAVAGD